MSGGIECHGAVASPTATTLLHFLNLALENAVAGADVNARLERLNDMLEVMVREERDPTGEEWVILAERSQAAHDAIQGTDGDDDGDD